MRFAVVVFVSALSVPTAFAEDAASVAAASSAIHANDNREPAGRLVGKTLRIELEAREGLWSPESTDGPGLPVQAFAVRGKKLSVPGPLIRVPEGTQIRATIRNALAEKIVLHGLHSRPGDAQDTVVLAPGERRELSFDAGIAGTYYYYGSTMPGAATNNRPLYRDAVLSGAFIVDPRGTKPDPEERIFMMANWRKDIALDKKLAKPGEGQKRTYAINGLSFPYTEKLTYDVGQRVRWRWINLAFEPHPMHLHGFHFDVLSAGDGERDVPFLAEQRPHVFTHRIEIGGTMTMAWTPNRAGNWLFHCHMIDHIGPHLRLRPTTTHVEGQPHTGMDHLRDGMSGLVLAITLKPRAKLLAPADTGARRQIKLFVQEQPHRFDGASALGYALQVGNQEPPPNTVEVPGPLLVLTRGEPTSIAITNRTNVDTAVHWHGMELESYFDGVPGWGGDGRRVTPPIAPGETFVADMTPPRAGTFMYHTHWHDALQLSSGMYGPLIVLEPGQEYDPTTERMVLVSQAPNVPLSGPLLLNGSVTPAPLEMQVGRTYRIRLINITPSNVESAVRLASGDQPIEWRNIAKDGVDLPTAQAVITKELLSLAVGETRDFEFQPTAAGNLRVEFRHPDGRFRTSIDVRVH